MLIYRELKKQFAVLRTANSAEQLQTSPKLWRRKNTFFVSSLEIFRLKANSYTIFLLLVFVFRWFFSHFQYDEWKMKIYKYEYANATFAHSFSLLFSSAHRSIKQAETPPKTKKAFAFYICFDRSGKKLQSFISVCLPLSPRSNMKFEFCV